MKFNLKFSKLPKPSDIKLPVDLSRIEGMDRENSRIVAWGLGALIVLMIVAGVVAFSLSLHGAEEIMVPDVKGMDLPAALIKLQDKELYPRISLRFTDDPTDKGRIVEQKPLPGTIVKAGRRVQLTVSRGPVADKVENYVGQDLNEVQIHLSSLFTTSRPLVTIKDPPNYIFDKSPAGTVIAQKPAPDTKIDGPLALELWVSRGPEKAQVSVPDLKGLSYMEAFALIEKTNVAVVFSMRKADGREKSGVVVSETPAAGATIPPTGRIQATVTQSDPQSGMKCGIFESDLPEYPYPLRVSLSVLLPTGERTPLLRVNHPGGKFTAPYFLPVNSILILSVLDREVSRVEVKGP
jgi:beta-lactam-binding protein with PASTA domain